MRIKIVASSIITKSEIFYFSIIIIASVVACRKILPNGSIRFIDLLPFSPDIRLAFFYAFTPYKPLALGGYGFKGDEHCYFLEIVFDILTRNSIIAQKVCIVSLFILSGISSYTFLKLFTNSKYGRFLGSFFYCFNPWVFAISSIGMRLSYALLPLCVYLIHKLHETNDFVYSLILAFILIGIHLHFIHMAILVILCIVIKYLINLKFRKALNFILLLFIASIPYAITTFYIYYRDIEVLHKSIRTLLMDVKYTYSFIGSDCPILSILSATPPSLYYPVSKGISLTINSILILIILSSVLLLINKVKKFNNSFLVAYLVVMTLLISFILFTHKGLTLKLYENISCLLYTSPSPRDRG